MSEPVTRPATYEDLLAVPANLVAEILNGRLVTHPRPAPRHAIASSSLGGQLIGPFQMGRGGPGGWWIVDEPELHLGEHVVVPDLAGWRRDRMPSVPETAWFELPPDWVCEVVSPSTARYDRVEKRDIYAQFEAGFLWLLDPDVRTLEAFELQQGRWVVSGTFSNNDDVAVAPFADAPFSLGALWAE